MTDAVDTFRRIAFMIFKWLGYALLFLVLLCAVVIGGYYAYEWFTYERHAAKIKASVITTVCTDKEFPLLVSIRNGSGKTLEKVSFSLSARKPDHSTDILEYNYATDDRIRKPGEEIGTCWGLPKLRETVADPLKLEWSVTSLRFTFAN